MVIVKLAPAMLAPLESSTRPPSVALVTVCCASAGRSPPHKARTIPTQRARIAERDGHFVRTDFLRISKISLVNKLKRFSIECDQYSNDAQAWERAPSRPPACASMLTLCSRLRALMRARAPALPGRTQLRAAIKRCAGLRVTSCSSRGSSQGGRGAMKSPRGIDDGTRARLLRVRAVSSGEILSRKIDGRVWRRRARADLSGDEGGWQQDSGIISLKD